MATITLTLIGETPEDFTAALRAVAQQFAETGQRVEGGTYETDASGRIVAAELEVSKDPAPARGRGRPKKNPGNDDTSPETPPETPTEAAPGNLVQDLTPAEAREQGIRELQMFMAREPSAMKNITDLQQKFAVKLLKDVPDDRSAEFLADVKLLVSGSPAAAA